MLRKSRVLVHILAAYVVLTVTVASAKEPFESHHDTMIRYYACNQDYAQPISPDKIDTLRWEATWDGNGFMHTPGPGASGVAHRDNVMRYLTWDGRCWEASWNPILNQFVHENVTTKRHHTDQTLNYLTWDRTKWSATRDGNEFFHIYIAGAENEVPWEKSVIEFFKKTGELWRLVISALPS
jgi:hypothetical protein